MKQVGRQKKRRAYFWGQGAEYLSILSLLLTGYRILARRYKCKAGEIDLIARRGDMICFIEVKARKTYREAVEAVSLHQRKRIIRAAEWYLTKNCRDINRSFHQLAYRFDVMAVEPWRLPTHVKDAWSKEL